MIKVHKDPTCLRPVDLDNAKRATATYRCPSCGVIPWWEVTHIDERRLFATPKTRPLQTGLELEP